MQSALLEVKDKSVHMLHKMVHDTSGELRVRPWLSRFISTQQSAGQFDSPKKCVRGRSKLKSGKRLRFKKFADKERTQISSGARVTTGHLEAVIRYANCFIADKPRVTGTRFDPGQEPLLCSRC